MLETPHTIVAATIAAKSGNPYLAIPLAILSHFVLDMTPHWNPHLTTKEAVVKKIDSNSLKIIIADSSLALLVGSGIAISYLPDYKRTILIFVCCFLAVLPDLIEAPYIFLNYRCINLKKWLSFQKKNQFNTNKLWGITTQLVVIIAALWWIIQK